MIDTHTHLYSEEFDNDIDEVVAHAHTAGVEKFMLPALDSSAHQRMLSLEARYPNEMYAMMGLYPCSVQPETWEQELAIVRQHLEKRRFCAIGEIGIDLYWDKSTEALQRKVFETQIDWAIEFDTAIVIHSRNSFPEIFEVLEKKKHPNLRGILHCFTGTLEDANRAIDLNMLLGIGGIVTFKNGKIDRFLNQIPLENIVLETDSPYLAPTPFRGKRNESAYVRYVLEKIADIYGKDIKEVERITTENALKIYQIDPYGR